MRNKCLNLIVIEERSWKEVGKRMRKEEGLLEVMRAIHGLKEKCGRRGEEIKTTNVLQLWHCTICRSHNINFEKSP